MDTEEEIERRRRRNRRSGKSEAMRVVGISPRVPGVAAGGPNMLLSVTTPNDTCETSYFPPIR